MRSSMVRPSGSVRRYWTLVVRAADLPPVVAVAAGPVLRTHMQGRPSIFAEPCASSVVRGCDLIDRASASSRDASVALAGARDLEKPMLTDAPWLSVASRIEAARAS